MIASPKYVKEGTEILEALKTSYAAEGKGFIHTHVDELNDMAGQHIRDGELDKARNLCLRSREVAAKEASGYTEGLVEMHLGTVHLADGGREKLDKAIECYSKSAKAFESFNKNQSQAVALMAQGTVYAICGNWYEAWRHYSTSLEVLGEPYQAELSKLRLKIERKCQDAKDNYDQQPPSPLPENSFHDQPESMKPPTEIVERQVLFGGYWRQFENIADGVAIWDPASKTVLAPLEKELAIAATLTNKKNEAEEWDGLLKALADLCTYTSSQLEEKSLINDLKRLVEKLVTKIVDNLSDDRHPASIEQELNTLVKKLQ